MTWAGAFIGMECGRMDSFVKFGSVGGHFLHTSARLETPEPKFTVLKTFSIVKLYTLLRHHGFQTGERARSGRQP